MSIDFDFDLGLISINGNGMHIWQGGGNVLTNTAVGGFTLALNTIGSNNTGMGANALANNFTGTDNTAVGSGALVLNTASYNTAVGRSALANTVDGGYNVAVGRNALVLNVSGNNNVALGTGAGLHETGSNKLYIDGTNTGSTTPLIYGQFDPTGGLSGSILINGALSVTGQITSTVSTGTAPLVIASTTTVANLSIGGNAATATTAGNVTGTVAIANGGTGQITSQEAANALVNRPNTITSSSTPTPVADTTDIFTVTALATAATFGVPTYTITPVEGQGLLIRIKDNGGAQTLAWNIIYRAVGVTLPLTTVPSKTLYVAMFYNFADTKWDVVGVSQE